MEYVGLTPERLHTATTVAFPILLIVVVVLGVILAWPALEGVWKAYFERGTPPCTTCTRFDGAVTWAEAEPRHRPGDGYRTVPGSHEVAFRPLNGVESIYHAAAASHPGGAKVLMGARVQLAGVWSGSDVASEMRGATRLLASMHPLAASTIVTCTECGIMRLLPPPSSSSASGGAGGGGAPPPRRRRPARPARRRPSAGAAGAAEAETAMAPDAVAAVAEACGAGIELLELTPVDGASPEATVHAAAQAAANTQPPSTLLGEGAVRATPLCAVAYALESDGAGGVAAVHLLITLHHAICDGRSAAGAVVATLATALTTGCSRRALPRLPSPTVPLPDLAYNRFMYESAWFYRRLQAVKLASELLPRRFAAFAPPAGHATALVRITMTPRDTGALVAAARAHRVSFNAVMDAAAAKAAADVIGSSAPVFLRFSTDLRQAFNVGGSHAVLGYCAGAGAVMHPRAATAGVWELADADRAASRHAVGLQGVDAQLAWVGVREALVSQFIARTNGTTVSPPATVLTSNIGDMSPAFRLVDGLVSDLWYCSTTSEWRTPEINAATTAHAATLTIELPATEGEAGGDDAAPDPPLPAALAARFTLLGTLPARWATFVTAFLTHLAAAADDPAGAAAGDAAAAAAAAERRPPAEGAAAAAAGGAAGGRRHHHGRGGGGGGGGGVDGDDAGDGGGGGGWQRGPWWRGGRRRRHDDLYAAAHDDWD